MVPEILAEEEQVIGKVQSRMSLGMKNGKAFERYLREWELQSQ